MTITPGSPEWYNQLASSQKGYFYGWRSVLKPWHGEDVFLQLVFQHLRPEMDVLDVACAQGEIGLALAPACRSVLGYDLAVGFIQLAQEAARERGLTNAAFVQHDSSPAANGSHPRIPAPDRSFDLLACSKGPFHWIRDARRVARPGAVLLMLVPDATPLEPWTERLPESLRWQAAADPSWARPAIEENIAAGGLSLDSWWSFDVPEVFPEPADLYDFLTWAKKFTLEELPSFAENAPAFEAIFKEFAGPEGLSIRRHRYIWKAVVPSP